MLQPAYSKASIANRIPEAIAICERWLRPYPAGASIPLVLLMQQIVTELLGVLLIGRGPTDALSDIITAVRFSLNCALTHQWPTVLLRLPRYRRAKACMLRFGREILAAHVPEGNCSGPRC